MYSINQGQAIDKHADSRSHNNSFSAITFASKPSSKWNPSIMTISKAPANEKSDQRSKISKRAKAVSLEAMFKTQAETTKDRNLKKKRINVKIEGEASGINTP